MLFRLGNRGSCVLVQGQERLLRSACGCAFICLRTNGVRTLGGLQMILTAENRDEFARHIFAGSPDEELLVALAEYEAYVPSCDNDELVEVLADTADLIRREMGRRESDPNHLITCLADGCSHRFFRVAARGGRASFCFDCADERFGRQDPRGEAVGS